MEKILGLDLGTNSLGWAIVERKEDNTYRLSDKGVCIFQDGVAHEKSGEKPAVQTRTLARASRKHYFRRRLRKIELLKVLMKYGWCPTIPVEALNAWKSDKTYPLVPDFLDWQKTDDITGKNPYADRHRCLTETLNLEQIKDRYTLGRAMYHICQRRGFLSNRKADQEDADGIISKGISNLSKEMNAAGCDYIGDFFYQLYQNGEKIRNHYTSRIEHYLAEFEAICEKQHLSEEQILELKRAIFYQRPLKSQKGTVGKCTFEKDKPRCSVSHPRYEEFRMFQFINSIKVKTCKDDEYRNLSYEEKSQIIPKFLRKSKPSFVFEDIAKQIAGKNNYCFRDDAIDKPYRFNFKMSTSVRGCPMIASLMSALGESSYETWENDLACQYLKTGKGKSIDMVINDVWHAMFSFDNSTMLQSWLQTYLQLDDNKARELVKTRIERNYASLSLKAINKILPHLKRGCRYDEAVFLANIGSVLPACKAKDKQFILEVEDNIRICLEDYDKNPTIRGTKEKAINDYLLGVADKVNLNRLYHPSMIETYQKAFPVNGKVLLGSPRTNALRNPMAMRALFRLRALINELLSEGKIDQNTTINIELSRGLNDRNRRKAIEDFQREQQKKHEEYRQKIKETIREETGTDIEPTEDDILKYQLWEEQRGICLYTGEQMRISSFIGANPQYDFEHTVPRSRGGDNSQMNKTLCKSEFNRQIKQSKLPSELVNYPEIEARLEALQWKEKIEKLSYMIDMRRRDARSASAKDGKDVAISQRHRLEMERDYLRGKYERFMMKEVPVGFSNRQGVDTGIIGKYSRLYLKTVFNKVFTVKGTTTSDFRKMWGLQKEYEKKERVYHIHHCIDAITIACIGKHEYDEWAGYLKKEELFKWGMGQKPSLPKPWQTFTEDVLNISADTLISHYTPDNMPKAPKKKIRKRGMIQKTQNGDVIYAQGDYARLSLNEKTFYGAIMQGEELKYVIRKQLDSIKEKDIKNIVDPIVRRKVQEAAEIYGLKQAISNGIWMNKEKGIPIKKVRLLTTLDQVLMLKEHRDKSPLDHKNLYYAKNDGNYCIAIYGSKKPSFRIINALEAAKMFNSKDGDRLNIPLVDGNGQELRFILKQGTMVLFYEKSPDEILLSDEKNLKNRLYKVMGFSTQINHKNNKKYYYGLVVLQHHQEARPAKDTNAETNKGLWHANEKYRPRIIVNHNQLNFLVEGYDFDLSLTGKITFRNRQ